MDQTMPSMNGIETVLAIKRHWKKCSILFYTDNNIDEDIQKAFRAGVSGYILRSANANEIMVAIARILSGSYHVSSAILPIILNRLCVKAPALHRTM
jgi:DNA-binding NarL/FixJ family response regulator